MIRPADARYNFQSCDPLRRKNAVVAENIHGLANEAAGPQVTHKTYKIPLVRIEKTQGKRIILRIGLAGKISDGLKGEHRHHIISPLVKLIGVNQTTHGRRLKMGILLVDKEDKANGFLQPFLSKDSSQLNHCG